MMKVNRSKTNANSRRGVMAVIVAFSLLVILAALALVLDRLWLQAAQVELETSAEVAVLAAAGVLADDALLISGTPYKAPLRRAKLAALRIAARNQAAGDRVELDIDRDIKFGHLVREEETGQVKFLETEIRPTSVVVTARRTRSRGNPIALLLQGASKQPVGDVVARVEATIDNRLIGLQALNGIPIPALPLAILNDDPSGKRNDTWREQIEMGVGQDRYAFDFKTGQVKLGQDGLPEIVLRTISRQESCEDANVQLVDFGNQLSEKHIANQIENGLTAHDLREFGGKLMFDSHRLNLTSNSRIIGEPVETLRAIIGQRRICFLYDHLEALGNLGIGRLGCVGIAAGRVMSVRETRSGSVEIVFQAAVTTTRTAILAAEVEAFHAGHPRQREIDVPRNPYIYKLTLTQ